MKNESSFLKTACLLSWLTASASSATAAQPVFISSESTHFTIRFVPGSAAERDLSAIIANRERAYKQISSRLSVLSNKKITITIFPDRESTPSGFGTGVTADGETIAVNYFNFTPCYEQTRYGHELTHALSSQLLQRHHSLPLLTEGLAEYLDQSGRNLHAELALSSRIMGCRPNPRVEGADLSREGFGSEIAYPKAGSFVKFLVETYGWEKFLAFYRGTVDIGAAFPDERLKNFMGRFKEVFGLELAAAEKDWDTALIPFNEVPSPHLPQADEEAIFELVLSQDKAAATHDLQGIAKAYDRINRKRIGMFEGNLKYYSNHLLKTDIRDIVDLGIKNGRRALVRTVRQFNDGKTFHIEYYVEKLEDGWRIQKEDSLK